MTRRCITIGLLSILTTTALWAQTGIRDLEITGNVVTAALDLPGVEADLTFTFEQAIGLTPENLGISAVLVSPGDPALLARLPSGVPIAIPAAFPVLLRMEPPATSQLTMNGIVSVEIYTHDLVFTSNGPLRLFAGSIDGPLEDATVRDGAGSYRVGTAHPEFSQHNMIVADPRPADVVLPIKLDALELALADNAGAIAAEVLTELEKELAKIRTMIERDATVAAIKAVEKFDATVEENSGAAIPDVWSAGQELVNVAGGLRSRADTLRYTLLRKANLSH